VERRIIPLCICLRIPDDRFVASEIPGPHMGHNTSEQALNGQVKRGDGQQIDCAILNSDLRGSVALPQSLKTALLATGAFTDPCPVKGTDMDMHNSGGFTDPLG